jgi:hypothetical protein
MASSSRSLLAKDARMPDLPTVPAHPSLLPPLDDTAGRGVPPVRLSLVLIRGEGGEGGDAGDAEPTPVVRSLRSA